MYIACIFLVPQAVLLPCIVEDVATLVPIYIRAYAPDQYIVSYINPLISYRHDGSDAVGVWSGAAETGSTRLAGDGAGDGGGGRTLESHPLSVFLPLFGMCGCVRTKG